jgi:putative endonuclease
MEGMMKSYYVYILASRRDGAIYVGITSALVKRVYEHRSKAVPSFASRYNITRLVWFEIYGDPLTAIAREKELKTWRRDWKITDRERQSGMAGFVGRDLFVEPRTVIPGRGQRQLHANPESRNVQRAVDEYTISGFRVRSRCALAPRNDGLKLVIPGRKQR